MNRPKSNRPQNSNTCVAGNLMRSNSCVTAKFLAAGVFLEAVRTKRDCCGLFTTTTDWNNWNRVRGNESSNNQIEANAFGAADMFREADCTQRACCGYSRQRRNWMHQTKSKQPHGCSRQKRSLRLIESAKNQINQKSQTHATRETRFVGQMCFVRLLTPNAFVAAIRDNDKWNETTSRLCETKAFVTADCCGISNRPIIEPTTKVKLMCRVEITAFLRMFTATANWINKDQIDHQSQRACGSKDQILTTKW